MKKRIIIPIIGTLLVLGGLSVLFIQIRNQRTSIVSMPPAPAHQTVNTSLAPAAQPVGYLTGNPVSIAIPSLDLSVGIIPGYYDAQTQQWTLTKTDAQYATITPEPNNAQGNTFIYGHALSNIFGALHKMPSGAEAVVTTDNGHVFYYKLVGEQVVQPQDSDAVLTATAQPTLTLQTCTGLLWQNRQLFSFNLEKAI
ncbi:MAG: sortase [Candidatus Saccharibacteria bacterium]